MGTGATIRTGGAINSTRGRQNNVGTSYYNKNQDPYQYGIVKQVNEDRSIVYTPLEDRISKGGEKFGIAYPFYGNNQKIPTEENIVPLLRGPSRFLSNDPANQYDKTTYYLDPITFQDTVNQNVTSDGTDDSTEEGNSFKSTTLGTVPNIKPSETIAKVYAPVLEKVFPDLSKGVKTLMTAQTQLEGFFPGSRSFRTNNPGNVYPKGNKSGFPTLEEGIQAQWTYVLGACYNGTSRYYKPTDTLYKYLSTYAPASDGNDPMAYTRFIVGYFRKNGYTNVNENTTLEEIKKLT